MKDSTDRNAEDLRRLARERMRSSFLGQTVRQLHELSTLLALPDPTVRDTVAHELERIADIASSFGLEGVEGAARVAAQGITPTAGAPVLAPLGRAVRDAGGHTRFPPIIIVAREPLLGKLQVEAARCCETLEFHDSVPAMKRRLRCEEPEAIVVPYDELDKLDAIDRAGTVFVYGGSGHDIRSRVYAASLGAKGFLPDRVEFRPLLERIRAMGHRRRSDHGRVLVVHDDEAIREALVQALGAAGAWAAQARRPEEIGPSLRESSPDLLVVGEQACGFAAADIAAAARMVPRQADLVVLAIADPNSTRDLVSAGCDGVIDAHATHTDMARMVSAWLDRTGGRPTGRDASTGLVDRPTLLRSVDRALSEARRGGRPLSVAIVELDGAADVHRRLGRGVGDSALRLLARCLEGAIRASDVVGRLDADGFMVVMPSCAADHARRRLGDARALFSALCGRDARMAGLTFSAGVADTEDGTDRLLVRAEEALERGRARDARGSIG